MKIINEDDNSITIEVGFVRSISLFIRLLGGVLSFFSCLALITEGINIISFILLLIVASLYPIMVASGSVVVTRDRLIIKKKLWFKTTETIIDISRYSEINVLHQLTYASNGGAAKQYSYLVLKQSGSFGSLSLGDYFWCYYTKDEHDFEKVIKLLSKNDSRKVSYDEDSSKWFNIDCK
jgi:hypothetical protein